MNCLNCKTEMTNYQVARHTHKLSYDMCDRCGSLWLDAGELDKMVFQVQGSIEYCEDEKRAELEDSREKCPRCDDSYLEKVRFLEADNIFLHRCRNCGGFWLDGGQLKVVDQELARIMPVKGPGFSEFVNNVHLPHWSHVAKSDSATTDFHIDGPPIHGAEVKGATSDPCPNDSTSLNRYKVFSMEFEGCPKCKGVWLVKDELRKLKNKADDGTLRWMNDEIENLEKTTAIAGNLRCPKCRTSKLVSVIFGNSKIVIDFCPQCHGTWLDRDGFQGIVDYLQDELPTEQSKQREEQFAKDIHRVASGGPESRVEELRDAASALNALISATIFEHPKLFKLCTSFPHFW